ncbi:peroxiredoxin-like family protein [Hanstruepera marina]|uniref:peroxiredoxin-like family protein n=1 Tax=Hanstruepera marina TaxID=2873265 RepID=UPI001CA69879|nr:peroxiredoxin-like family protein [Hanstruepera marina]
MKSLSLLFTLFLSFTLFAQVPEQAEDISPLLIGEQLPDARLLGADGVEVSLQYVLKQKPSVVVFYRGGWCPYCNQQLGGLAEVESQVIELGYQIIAISPDHFEMLNPTAEKEEVQYQLYADINAELIQAVGIGFKTPEKAKGYIAKKTKKEVTDILPVPTVLIVDKKGKIYFEYINPNYSTRISEEILLANLKVLKDKI